MIVSRPDTPKDRLEQEAGWFYWDEYDLERAIMQEEEESWNQEFVPKRMGVIIPFPTLRPPRKKKA